MNYTTHLVDSWCWHGYCCHLHWQLWVMFVDGWPVWVVVGNVRYCWWHVLACDVDALQWWHVCSCQLVNRIKNQKYIIAHKLYAPTSSGLLAMCFGVFHLLALVVVLVCWHCQLCWQLSALFANRGRVHCCWKVTVITLLLLLPLFLFPSTPFYHMISPINHFSFPDTPLWVSCFLLWWLMILHYTRILYLQWDNTRLLSVVTHQLSESSYLFQSICFYLLLYSLFLQ